MDFAIHRSVRDNNLRKGAVVPRFNLLNYGILRRCTKLLQTFYLHFTDPKFLNCNCFDCMLFSRFKFLLIIESTTSLDEAVTAAAAPIN